MTKVRVKRTFEFAGNVLKKGDTPELPDSATSGASPESLGEYRLAPFEGKEGDPTPNPS